MPNAIAAGNHYSLLLKDGVLLSSGENTRGQLGRGAGNEASLVGFEAVNLPANFGEEIVSIAAGQNHNAFVTESGRLYVWGLNNQGALGLGTTSGSRIVPQEIVVLENGAPVTFASATLATQSSFAISTTGDLYVFGNNQNGQLGIGSLQNQAAPVKVPASAFGGEAVAAVSPGTSFTLVLTEGGSVYAMGRNTDRQLGPNGFADPALGVTQWRSPSPVSVPIPLEAGDRVVSIEAGGNTAIAVTASGKVYGWGQTDFGQLLQGTVDGNGVLTPATADVVAPTLLQGLPADVAEVQIGSRWAVARTASGEVWVWGNAQGDEGESPLGIERALPDDVAVAPMRVPGLEGVTIVDLNIGPNHTLAIAEDGAVYGWGSYAQGRMGFAPNGAPAFLSGVVRLDLVEEGYKTIVGTAAQQGGDEVLHAGSLAPDAPGAAIYGFGGDDTLHGSARGDHLVGGIGNDRLNGNGGDDDIEGQSGDDRIFGNEGSDRLLGGTGRDNIDGGAGADEIDGGAGDDVLNGGDGNDLIEAGEGADYVFAGAGHDRILGGAGNDTLDGAAGRDDIEGGDGDDKLQGKDGNDRLSGGAGDDLLQGGEGSDELLGGLGRNILSGDGGNDSLIGGTEGDRLSGGEGGDSLFGDLGRDILTGGTGSDVFRFATIADSRVGASDRIADWTAGDRIDLDLIDADGGTGARNGNQAFDFIGGAAFSAAGQVRVVLDGGNTVVQMNTDDDLATIESEIELNGFAGLLRSSDFIL